MFGALVDTFLSTRSKVRAFNHIGPESGRESGSAASLFRVEQREPTDDVGGECFFFAFVVVIVVIMDLNFSAVRERERDRERVCWSVCLFQVAHSVREEKDERHFPVVLKDFFLGGGGGGRDCAQEKCL